METRSAYRTTSLARLVTLSSAQVQYIYCAALTCAVNKLMPGVFPAWETLILAAGLRPTDLIREFNVT